MAGELFSSRTVLYEDPMTTPPLYGVIPPHQPSFLQFPSTTPANTNPISNLEGKHISIKEVGTKTEQSVVVQSADNHYLHVAPLTHQPPVMAGNVTISPEYYEMAPNSSSIPLRQYEIIHQSKPLQALKHPDSKDWLTKVQKCKSDVEQARESAQKTEQEAQRKQSAAANNWELAKVFALGAAAVTAIVLVFKHAMKDDPSKDILRSPTQAGRELPR